MTQAGLGERDSLLPKQSVGRVGPWGSQALWMEISGSEPIWFPSASSSLGGDTIKSLTVRGHVTDCGHAL